MRGLESWKKIHRLLLPKEIQREDLKPWNHIYTRCRDNTKRHGIYDGKRNVIQLNITRPAGFVTHEICPTCGNHDQLRPAQGEGLVISTSFDDFLSGGKNIYLFEYGVDLAHFGFTNLFTLASSDPPQVVEERASFLLNDGSAADHYRYINNGKDFAIYCKTALLVIDRIDFRRSRQTAFFLAITAVAFFDYEQELMLAATFWGLFGRYVGIYCICRFAFDIRARPNVIKVDQARSLPQVDEILSSGAGWGFQRTLQSLVDTFLLISMLAFALSLLSTRWSEPLQVWSDTLKVVWSLPYITFFYWAVLQRRLLSNKVQKGQLKRGDHIYTYRRGHSYSHHGIYVEDRRVIHLVRGEASISGGGQPTQNHVETCCINGFLAGGELSLYKYGVNIAFFMAKTRGGICTHVSADPTEDVVRRAEDLLQHREFGAYNLFNNNCEDFAVYCKTSLFSTIDFVSHGTNGQISSFVAIFIAFVFLKSLTIPTTNFIDVAAAVYFIYSMLRYAADWGTRLRPEELVDDSN